MAEAFLYGSGGTPGTPDFKVTTALSLPDSGKEKEIVLITSIPIANWEIFSVPPTWASAQGYVYLQSLPTDSGEWPNFNVIRNKRSAADPAIWAKLGQCWQYQSGVWKPVEAYQRRNGQWVQFSFLSSIPAFTYTGSYALVQDDDTPIADPASYQGNWKLRLLTSGTFTITGMNTFSGAADLFLVGGGGAGGRYARGDSAGGGGGYTKTISAAALSVNTPMNVHIGAGGTSPGGDGGTTSFGSYTVSGGGGGSTTNHQGGSGGSGGSSPTYSSGGTDGSKGYGEMPGTGQGSTTREFGQSGGKLYSTGGGGGQDPAIAGGENTGDGGDGTMHGQSGAAGGSGIVILRNAR